ncbi:Uncharacterised protein [Neisseria meningitidis]|nr:Uncharacterised protein [Neisseria meningitidis]CWS43954.1 Uncharacterised protein [Neisseria meningitidis]CWS60004.1 Uncharacterised protein [Neisseria meningitidis]
MPSETVQTHRFPNKGIPNEENPHQNLRHHHTGRRIGRRSGRCRCRRAGLFPRQQPGRRYCPRQKNHRRTAAVCQRCRPFRQRKRAKHPPHPCRSADTHHPIPRRRRRHILPPVRPPLYQGHSCSDGIRHPKRRRPLPRRSGTAVRCLPPFGIRRHRTPLRLDAAGGIFGQTVGACRRADP